MRYAVAVTTWEIIFSKISFYWAYLKTSWKKPQTRQAQKYKIPHD